MKILCSVINEKIAITNGKHCSMYEPSSHIDKRCCGTCLNQRSENDISINLIKSVPAGLGENKNLSCSVYGRMCKRGEGLRCPSYVASHLCIDHYCSNCEHSFNYKPKKD